MNPERLYATAGEARWAIDAAAYAEGGQPHPHTWLGAICEEAECYCGVQMPLGDDGKPKLTFEEWIDYHDGVLLRALENDAASYADSDENPANPPKARRDHPAW